MTQTPLTHLMQQRLLIYNLVISLIALRMLSSSPPHKARSAANRSKASACS